MPNICPIHAVMYDTSSGSDLSDRIAPPYDVLDEGSKAELLSRNDHNIVAVDLPHLPPKTVGPDATYEQAGQRYRQWLDEGVLKQRDEPAMFVYRQTFEAAGSRFCRTGLIAGVQVQPFGDSPEGHGGVYAHEQTFSSPKEDRLKLMRASQTQLSPIFGMTPDADQRMVGLLDEAAGQRDPDMTATTANDGVKHELWAVTDADQLLKLREVMLDAAIFIADGHHRYNTALNYQSEQPESVKNDPDHPANFCMFVIVSMQDPGMIVLPTHRVLSGLDGFSIEKLTEAAQGKLTLEPLGQGDLDALEKAIADRGSHAMGLVDANLNTCVAVPADADPLKASHGQMSEAWRQLDVAIVQHLLVEQICAPTFASGSDVAWKFPHSLEGVKEVLSSGGQLGVILQATPLQGVRAVSEAGELMPQKSTFFYPKLATGMVLHPLA